MMKTFAGTYTHTCACIRTQPEEAAVSCQGTEPDLSSVAALIPVLQTTDMRDAFNFPLKCPGTTEG